MDTKNALLFIPVLFVSLCSCNNKSGKKEGDLLRLPVDTVGFAHLGWQMDSVMNRIDRNFFMEIKETGLAGTLAWKAAICPHDDYAYASWLYPALLGRIKAPTIIIFGVAHKAKQMNLENRLVFDSFDAWQSPYGPVKISPLREEIIQRITPDFYTVSDSMQRIEHSVEAMIPFLQYFNKNVEVVSILVPSMKFGRMEEISNNLSSAIFTVMKKRRLSLGKDLAILITTDAVHYGNEEWGGRDYAPFGTDSTGYRRARELENEILMNCFSGALTDEKIRKFYDYTLNPEDYHEYKWTWCGRYCIPLGLKTVEKLQKLSAASTLTARPVGYMTSIDHAELPVEDLRMGKTAIATSGHWVGYAAAGYY